MRELPGKRSAALTFTFDDGTMDHYDFCAPLLEKYGFRGTFFVMPGYTREDPRWITLPSQLGDEKRLTRFIMGWKQIKQLHKRGHEIGNHSWSHTRLWKVMDTKVLRREITDSAKELKDQLGTKPRSWAWPYYRPGRTQLSEELVRESHWIIRRRHPQLSLGDTMSAFRAARWCDKAANPDWPGWWLFVVHCISEDGELKIDHVQKHILEAAVKRASEVTDKVWVCTMRELVPYMEKPYK